MAEEGLKWALFAVKNRAEVSGLPMVDVGIAHVLALFCAEKCNGGRIIGAKSWKKVEWLRYVGLDKKLSKNSERLWHFEGEDLVVDFYDAEAERRMVAKREAQRANARKKWGGDAMGDAMGYAMADANGMPTECHGSATGLYNNNNNKNKNNMVVEVKGSSTAAGACDGEPATTTTTEDDEVFRRWLTRLCGAHPTLRGCGILAPDVAEAAEAAYARCPQMEEEAELIGAYMADRLQEDRYRHKFWRPLGQARFFEKLEDVLAHARAWDRETGWGAKRKKKAAKAAEGRCTMDDVRCGSKAASPRGEEDEPASEEEMEKFRAELRGLRCGSEAPSAHGKGGEG